MSSLGELVGTYPFGLPLFIGKNDETAELSQPNILIIDDDETLTLLLTDYLSLEGFTVSVSGDGEEGLMLAKSGTDFDVILLDVMLPKIDGFQVLKILRQTHTTPVILLTAKGEEFDRVFGLELGADDYLAKPFSTRELLARIKALARRIRYTQTSALQPNIYVGPICLDNRNREVRFSDHVLDLTGREFSILQLLISNHGRVTNKDAISQAAFGRALAPYDRSIDMHISNVRKKLASHTKVEVIRTIRGGGYMVVELWNG